MRLWKEAREFKEWAEGFGWVFEGAAGNGHLVFTHPRGGRVQVSATPSDPRTRENERKRLLRLIGAREAKPNAARYRGRRREPGFVDTVPGRREVEAPWVAVYERLKVVDERLVKVGRDHPDARRLALERIKLGKELEGWYKPVPPLPKVF